MLGKVVSRVDHPNSICDMEDYFKVRGKKLFKFSCSTPVERVKMKPIISHSVLLIVNCLTFNISYCGTRKSDALTDIFQNL